MTAGMTDEWDKVAQLLAKRGSQRAQRQVAPADDAWDAWSIEVLKGHNGPNEYYIPQVTGGFTIGGMGGFSHETPFETAWRLASNRMKKESDLWKRHIDAYADPWERWCGARGMASERVPAFQQGISKLDALTDEHREKDENHAEN